jgi:hypothetical protein
MHISLAGLLSLKSRHEDGHLSPGSWHLTKRKCSGMDKGTSDLLKAKVPQ